METISGALWMRDHEEGDLNIQSSVCATRHGITNLLRKSSMPRMNSDTVHGSEVEVLYNTDQSVAYKGHW